MACFSLSFAVPVAVVCARVKRKKKRKGRERETSIDSQEAERAFVALVGLSLQTVRRQDARDVRQGREACLFRHPAPPDPQTWKGTRRRVLTEEQRKQRRDWIATVERAGHLSRWCLGLGLAHVPLLGV